MHKFYLFIITSLHQATYPALASWLTHLLQTGLPSSWRRLAITPIYKQRGDPADAANYRPISVLPPFAKLLALLLLHRMERLPHLLEQREPVQAGSPLPPPWSTWGCVYSQPHPAA